MPTLKSALTVAFLALPLMSQVDCTTTSATSTDTVVVGPTIGVERHEWVDVCSDAHGDALRCHAKRRLDTTSQTTPAGFAPADLQNAYALPSSGGSGLTIAIVDAQDDPNAEADLSVYRAQFGLPPCTTANGCFQKVNEAGQASPLPAPSGSWSQEIAVDLDMASAACPACNILLVEASSSRVPSLGAAVNTAARLGAAVISNSYGGPEVRSDIVAGAYFDHPGILLTVSSGDGGYGAEFPASLPSVLSVGGTSLVKAANARGWSETAWGDGGSGCSRYQPKPAWQTDTGCARRTVADVAAVGDPNTGVAVYESYKDGSGGGDGWSVFGGTSVAAPLVAGIFVVTGHATASPEYPYANRSLFNDVTSGANGSCAGSYLCTADIAYDGPTGIGTPIGSAMRAGGLTDAGIANGSFSLGTFSGWTTTGGASSVTSTLGTYQGNLYAAELGNQPTGVAGASTVAQTFTASAGTSKISIVYAVHCSGSGQSFGASLTDDMASDTTTIVAPGCPAQLQWTTSTASVIPGHSYTVTLTNVDDGQGAFSLIGDVALL